MTMTMGACIVFSCVNISWRTEYLFRLDKQIQHSDFLPGRTAHPTTRDNDPSQEPLRNQRSKYQIPRIVHQTYKSTDLPPNFKSWRDECITQNPGWEFKIWTDDDNLHLVEEHYPQLLDLYLGYDIKIKRIDMVRFLYLHKFGGVYMDMDMTCLKLFGSVLDQYYGKSNLRQPI